MELLFIYLGLALGISFLCSVLEAILLSTPHSFISMKVAEGSKAGLALQELKINNGRPISAILTLNTIAHTFGAAGVGAQAIKIWGDEYFALISVILTILILVLSEIIPKTLGANYYRVLSMPCTRLIQLVTCLCYPLVWILEKLTNLISPKTLEASMSREEVSAMVDAGTKEGVIKMKENVIIQNIIKMEKISVRDVMTPRVVCTTVDEDETLEAFHEDEGRRPFSRIPVYKEEKDIVSGYVLILDIMEYLAEDQHHMTLAELKRPILALPDTTSVFMAWEKLISNREHIAIIEDEYGTFEGIITMEDVMETILGLEIMDEKDTVADMQKFARDKWQERMAKYKQFIKRS